MIKNYIASCQDRAYAFIIPVPTMPRQLDCAPCMTFVLNIDWSEECLYLSESKKKNVSITFLLYNIL